MCDTADMGGMIELVDVGAPLLSSTVPGGERGRKQGWGVSTSSRRGLSNKETLPAQGLPSCVGLPI